MAESEDYGLPQEKIVYDGKAYKTLKYKEILNNGNPTGHFVLEEEKQITKLGTFLDMVENQQQLKTDVEKLYKPNFFNNYIGMLTDNGANYFIITNNVRLDIERSEFFSWYDWIIEKLPQFGYINDPYVVEENKIKFIITPKDNDQQEKYPVYLIAMDDYCTLCK